ncbi:MAG: 30S ribosomal protein S27e [Methanomassiliicoccales archaeon]
MADVRTGKFIKIKCPDCGNEQIAFKKPSTNVVCLVCGSVLIRPTGGKGDIRGELLGVVD